MDKSFIKNVLSEFPGKMVTVNNHKIHIYTEGKGTPSLVFLSGSGTSSPMYDFKTLFTKMSDEYQIAVLEKAGYGFSEITNMSRDIDTILFETKTVLREANINPPYILLPHSMSAIEALYWVQCYPNEIKAIIGIDPALPPFYENMNLNSKIKILKFASKIINGKLKRLLLPIIANSLPPIKYGVLNEFDKNICRAITYHKTLTNDMLNEVLMCKKNAERINVETLKTVPMLFFITRGWEKLIRDYTKELNIEIVPFNAGHYLHDILPEELSNRSKIFIKNNIK
jgi:pimeloyl-ACP methyl ester carboxylesterase